MQACHCVERVIFVVVRAKPAGLGGGLFSFFKGLAGQKTLTLEDINPVLDKMKEHLVGKILMNFALDTKMNHPFVWFNHKSPRMILALKDVP